MARRLIEITGRLASVAQGVNTGPLPGLAIKPNAANQEISWSSPWILTGTNTSFQLMTETWIYPNSGSLTTVYRNRNSSSGVQDSFALTTTGGISWNFDLAGAFGPAHFDVVLPADTFPINQWVHILHASDMTDPVLANRKFEHVVNGTLVPASSRTTNTLTNNLNGWADPHANTHDVFLMSTPSAASRYWMIQDFLDLTIAANVAKFIDTSNFTPAQLGPTGRNPTGNLPTLFMQNSFATILENAGSERDADSVDGTWEDAGHGPTSPARFAHRTGTSPDNAGLEKATATLGLADSQQVSLSMWFKSPAAGVAGRLLIASDNSASDKLVIGYNTSGLVTVEARNSSATLILDAAATVTDIADDSWHHIAVSINMQAATSADAVRIFVDDGDESPTVSTFVGSGTINLAQTGLIFAVLNHSGSATLTRGEFSQFWCDPIRFVDFSVAATRANFVQTTSTYIPIDLGDDGSTPTGNQPLIYVGQGPTFVETTPLLNTNQGTFSGDFDVSRGPWLAPTDNPAVSQLGT